MVATLFSTAETTAARLVLHARTKPDERVFTFLAVDGTEEAYLTYADLLSRTAGVAARLTGLGLRGERVLLLHPPGPDFVIAFCACLLAGAVAVPLPPPVTRRLRERTRTVIDDCRAAAILATAFGLGTAEEIAHGMRVIASDTIERAEAPAELPTDTAALAFLQYTSGSTGVPKGVMVTVGNLAANAEQIGAAFGLRPDDVAVSWLPLHHDMGLIGSVVAILHHGLHCVHLSPPTMVAQPIKWLQAVSTYRATLSGGPDFAWRLLADRLAPADLAGLDLARWRVAYTGAEPVRPSTLERAGSLLAAAGFQTAAFLPCYGLAEATLLVSGEPPTGGLRIATPAGSDRGYVGCGAPVPPESVAIVDADGSRRLPEGLIGAVLVSGPHVAAGYWGRAEDTAVAFHAAIPGDSRSWLRTGDLGFLAEGRLFITGRTKDLLIVNGRKYHAEDVEASVQAEVAECARGACAAFQLDIHQGAGLVVAVEVESQPDAEVRAELEQRIHGAVWRGHGLVVEGVAVVRIGRLPRTTSGKIRRAEARAAYQEGKLG